MTLFQAFGQFAGQAEVGEFDLIASTSFTTASEVVFDNCFSADYDLHLILSSIVGTTTTGSYAQLRASGVDASGSDYDRQYVIASGTGVSTTQFLNNTFFHFICGELNTTRTGHGLSWIKDPFSAVPTTHWPNTVDDPTASIAYRSDVGVHTVSTSYDGIRFFPGSGTMTGDIQIYGWRV